MAKCSVRQCARSAAGPAPCHRRRRVGEQVVGEHHPVARRDRCDLVAAVGVERDKGQLLLRRRGRSHSRRRGRRPVPRRERRGRATTRVPTIASSFSESWCGTKNCPWPYTSIECSSARSRVRREPEFVPEVLQRRSQRRPAGSADLDLIRGISQVSRTWVEQRLLPPPEHRRPRHRDQLLRLGCADRKAHWPDAGHLELEKMRRGQQLSAERPGRLRVVEQPRQPFPCRLRHASALMLGALVPRSLTVAAPDGGCG